MSQYINTNAASIDADDHIVFQGEFKQVLRVTPLVSSRYGSAQVSIIFASGEEFITFAWTPIQKVL